MTIVPYRGESDQVPLHLRRGTVTLVPPASESRSALAKQDLLARLLVIVLLFLSAGCGRVGYDHLAEDGGFGGLGDDASTLSAALLDLSLSLSSPLVPDFASATLGYQVDTSLVASEVMVTPTAVTPSAVILVNGERVTSSASSSPIALALGSNRIVVDVSVGSASLRYVVDVTRAASLIGQIAYAKASNTDAGDSFGLDVSLFGDTLAVGAFGEESGALGVNGDEADNGASNSGAVYIFRLVGGVWSQEAYLKASNTDAGDSFGTSVSLSSDTLAVGAYKEDSSALGVNGDEADNSAGSSGAVYLFQ